MMWIEKIWSLDTVFILNKAGENNAKK